MFVAARGSIIRDPTMTASAPLQSSRQSAIAREPQSIHELLRIMDVATALRRSRELAEKELAIDETKAQLRQRLAAAAQESGDPVTAAEIDAAIDQYYASLHRYDEPKRGAKVLIAHAWVRRRAIAIVSALVLGAMLSVWWLFLREAAPWSGPMREQGRLSAVADPLAQTLERARAIASDDAARTAIDALARETATALAARDERGLAVLGAQARELFASLEASFELHVISRQGERSGIDAYYEDQHGKRVSGYYLIVEARTPDGRILERTIRDAELQRDVRTRKWGEQVDKAVYDRVAADKQADGIVDDSLFARKPRGALEEQTAMVGVDGKTPLQRGRRITKDL